MDASQSAETFSRRIKAIASTMSIKNLLEEAINSYADTPVDGLVVEGGDALLFQYGAYDWGAGLRFEVDLTRQFIEVERNDDDNVVSQFHLTCFYEQTDALVSMGSEERWCESATELPAFYEWIMKHPVVVAIEKVRPLKTETRWELA